MTHHLRRLIILSACLLSWLATGCASSPGRWRPAVSSADVSYEALQRLHDAGIDAIEVTLSDMTKLPASARAGKCGQIVDNARKAGVEIWSVHIPFGKTWDISLTNPQMREKALANNREALELCKLLGPKKAVIHASAEPIPDVERSARLAAAKQALQELTPEFAAAGIQLALEDLPRTCLGNTSAEILWLIDGIGGLGVCFDTNHLLKESSEDFARAVGPHIVTLHVSDYDGKDERHWMAGDGIIHWPAVAQALTDARYGGPFLYETSKHKSGSPVQPKEYVRFLEEIERGLN